MPQADDLRNIQSGLIRIGTFSSVAAHWLPKIIAAFQKDHPLSGLDKVPLAELCKEPFILLEKGARVESGLGISMLPELILKRIPYEIVAKELDVPACRTIAFCLRDKKAPPLR